MCVLSWNWACRRIWIIRICFDKLHASLALCWRSSCQKMVFLRFCVACLSIPDARVGALQLCSYASERAARVGFFPAIQSLRNLATSSLHLCLFIAPIPLSYFRSKAAAEYTCSMFVCTASSFSAAHGLLWHTPQLQCRSTSYRLSLSLPAVSFNLDRR